MMGSMFSSISGLKANTSWMNVIGNNIANVSTVGFKDSRITFKDTISQMLGFSSGANGASNLGGINPVQQGLGVSVGSIDTIMTQGAIQTTGNPTDIAIDGAGFFIVKSGSETLYTRAGNFYFDNAGNMVSSSGALVQGWQRQFTAIANPNVPMVLASDSLSTNGTVRSIQIPQNLVLGPKMTTEANVGGVGGPNAKDEGIQLKGNLDSNTPWNANAAASGIVGADVLPTAGSGYTPDAVSVATIYDSLGTQHEITFYWTQSPGNPTGLGPPAPAVSPAVWNWNAYDTTGGRLIDAGAPVAQQAIPCGWATGISFSADGSLNTEYAAFAFGPGPRADIELVLNNGALTPFDVSVNIGTPSAGPAIPGLRDGITGDFGNGTYDVITGAYIPKETVYTSFVDGYSEGTLTGMSVDQTGGINCRFSNNQIITMAKVGLANFTNPQGLEKVGSTDFAQSANSGLPQISTAGNAGLGITDGGSLEASNVDLSVELTNMIIAQRGFEANARIITTSSDMLNTLVQLGR